MADTLSLTAEEQSQLDQMRADDAQPGSPAPSPPPADTPPPQGTEPPPQPQRTVPLAALHEERERRKESDRQLNEERARIRTLEERTNLLLQRFGQPQQPNAQTPAEPSKPEIPPLDKDPVGHILGTQQDLARQLQANQQNWQQQQQQHNQILQNMQAISALTQRAQAVEQEFQAEHPDYPAAVAHLVRADHQELIHAGYNDAAERAQIIQQKGLGIAARSFQMNRNPAEAIYELAKLRGYAAPAADSAQPAQPASSTPQQRLENVAQGQQQARGLGNTRGSGPTPLTAQRLLEMNETEFAKMLETPEGMEFLGA